MVQVAAWKPGPRPSPWDTSFGWFVPLVSEMPDWLDTPYWPVGVLVGAVIVWSVNQVMPGLSRRVRDGLRRVDHLRKFVIGTKRTRAGVISRWRKAPPWVLRATVFHWFEADPQAWWEYVRRVYDSHDREPVREDARGLLWVEKEASSLQILDVYARKQTDGRWGGRSDHVLALQPRGDGKVDVVYKVGFSPNFTRHTWNAPEAHPVRVNRGWCPLNACSYCSLNEQEFEALIERMRAGR